MSLARGSEEKKGRLAWGVQAAFEFDEGWLGLGGALVLCAFKYARAGTIQGAEKNIMAGAYASGTALFGLGLELLNAD
jgi:hypothetical protein